MIRAEPEAGLSEELVGTTNYGRNGGDVPVKTDVVRLTVFTSGWGSGSDSGGSFGLKEKLVVRRSPRTSEPMKFVG